MTAAPETFRQNALFAGLADAAIAECASQFTVVRARRRQVLFRQGDPCHHVYCLLRGSFRVSRLAEDGSEFTTRLARHADLFGEESLFEDTAFNSSATALSDAVVAVCSAARLKWLALRYPALSINLASYFRAEQDRTLDRLQQVASKPVRERLMSLLREIGARRYGEEDGAICLTHGEIASLVGSTRETVSLELNKLARAGLISKQGRKILAVFGGHRAA